MSNVGLMEVTVNVVAGHRYHGNVVGAVGPVSVHLGGDIADPVLTRVRDDESGFLWAPDGEGGPQTLLVSGWPNQPGQVSFTVTDLGKNKRSAV